MRPILWIAVGAGIMFVLLKVLAAREITAGGTFAAFKDLSKTQQAANLVRTNEFHELVKTSAFKTLIKTLAEDQLITMAKMLTNIQIVK